uniref:Uncharacterized protein n=1 Tax=Anguilla anguilla TaxID=7936 RepID=A0A0E9UIJ3_ANGAN
MVLSIWEQAYSAFELDHPRAPNHLLCVGETLFSCRTGSSGEV